MSYNDNSCSSPEILPNLAAAADKNLVDAKHHLRQFRTDKTITSDQVEQAMGLYTQLIAQDDHYVMLIKGWLRLGLVPKGMRGTAKRALHVFERTTLVASKVLERARAYKVRPRKVILDFPVREIGMLAAGIEGKIRRASEDLRCLRRVRKAPVPMMTREGLERMVADYLEAKRMLAAVPPQLRRWRAQNLTRQQAAAVTALEKRVRVLRAQVNEVLAFGWKLRGKTFDAIDTRLFLAGVLKDVVTDA
jgi:hypothetical protein